MNKIFKKAEKEVIELDSKHYLTTDGFKGVCLVFHETRKKTTKKDVEVDFEYEEKWYHPTVGGGLQKFVELSQKQIKNTDEILAKTEALLSILEDFKTKYKNW